MTGPECLAYVFSMSTTHLVTLVGLLATTSANVSCVRLLTDCRSPASKSCFALVLTSWTIFRGFLSLWAVHRLRLSDKGQKNLSHAMEGVATSERVTALGSCHSEYVLQTRSSHCGMCSSPRIWVIVHILRANHHLHSLVSAKSDLAVCF